MLFNWSPSPLVVSPGKRYLYVPLAFQAAVTEAQALFTKLFAMTCNECVNMFSHGLPPPALEPAVQIYGQPQ